MLERLVGLETEYAIRFSAEDGPRAGNDVIYQALIRAIGRLVRIRPGSRFMHRQIFTENGGAFYYEFLPFARDGGLIEGSTPECRSPSQLLLYQKAQDGLLFEALAYAEKLLGKLGFRGRLGLLKNCRDAGGHVYGAQENYEVELASGLRLFIFRAGVALLLPLVALQAVIAWLLVAAIILAKLLGTLGMAVAVLVVPRWRSVDSFNRLCDAAELRFERVLERHGVWLEQSLWWPTTTPLAWLLRLTAFRCIRRDALAFLISRPVVTGCGMLDDEGRFGLSEKGPSMGRLMRHTVSPKDRSIFDISNLMKFLMLPMTLRFSAVGDLFRRRQRLQLGLSDSNVAQVAEYLKIGTTALVLDMVESGYLDDAPRLVNPLEALGTLISDPGLRVRVAVRGGEPMSALDLQRYYLERARQFTRESPATSLEAHDIVRLWSEALDALASNPSKLVGRLDWVTKKSLLEQSADEPPAVLKKLDLRYHELGYGYLARMEEIGAAPRMVDDKEVRCARTEPPEATPASLRGRLIKDLTDPNVRFSVSWDSVRIGWPLRGRVVRLVDRRNHR